MVKVFVFGQMEKGIMVIGKMIILLGIKMVLCFMPMEMNILVNLKIIKLMDMEHIHTILEESTKDIGLTICNMEKEKKLGLMVVKGIQYNIIMGKY